MEALQIELYFSLFVIAFILGMVVYFIRFFMKKIKEEEEKQNR